MAEGGERDSAGRTGKIEPGKTRPSLTAEGPIPSCLSQLVGILLSQILVNQIKDQIKLQLYNQQHRADPWY